MASNSSRQLLYPKLSYDLQGCFFKVYNSLGHGHKEVVYQKALAVELEKRKIPFEREKSLDISYEEHKVGRYQPDFVIDGKIIVEIKALGILPKKLIKQVVYYLKGTGFQLGYLVNFGGEQIQIYRRIWTPEYRKRGN